MNNIVKLIDEDNNEIEFVFIDTISYNNNEYGILQPLGGEQDEACLFRLIEKDNDVVFENIEDDLEFKAVCEIYYNEE